MNTVTATWQLTLQVESSNESNTKALADALTTDEAIDWDGEKTSFRFSIEESKAKDLRAMWNTRVRGLIAVDNLLGVITNSKQGEHSSTQSD